MPVAQVVRWRDDLCVYFKSYADREDALRDLGLSADELDPDRPVTASKNLDLVRSICAAWELGDFTHGEWADPRIEYVIAHDGQPSAARGFAIEAKWKGRTGRSPRWAHRGRIPRLQTFRAGRGLVGRGREG